MVLNLPRYCRDTLSPILFLPLLLSRRVLFLTQHWKIERDVRPPLSPTPSVTFASIISSNLAWDRSHRSKDRRIVSKSFPLLAVQLHASFGYVGTMTVRGRVEGRLSDGEVAIAVRAGFARLPVCGRCGTMWSLHTIARAIARPRRASEPRTDERRLRRIVSRTEGATSPIVTPAGSDVWHRRRFLRALNKRYRLAPPRSSLIICQTLLCDVVNAYRIFQLSRRREKFFSFPALRDHWFVCPGWTRWLDKFRNFSSDLRFLDKNLIITRMWDARIRTLSISY